MEKSHCDRCFGIFISLLLLFALSVPVRCDDADDLVSGINSFRQTTNAPALTRNDKADCVADEIANQLENRPCTSNVSQSISDYPNVAQKCNVDANTTSDGIVLPVCVPNRVPTLVLTNYTQTQHARFLNNTRYTGVGFGSEEDWTVLVLTTSTTGGSFAGQSQGHALFASGWAPLLCAMLLTAILV
ncbi:hypothetical protein F511_11319 [Dorcoceras hygrometricum]|uniref:Uncharacterized GPI-anchored protein At5g19230-like domain-containing protein n=1 Tax=Dorcoceras hygrometricum TaxID=472368 RepID=A0A2Z7BZM3_9LAMI|nr:hypothetical protein F511_11319 [Dorcoceras hygrometricum]